jgi:hypothetical protein
MGDLEKIFNTMSVALYGFKNDLEKMQSEIKNEKKVEDNKRIITSSSIEPMTLLRKNAVEIKQAEEKPREAFINDRLTEILGG